MKWGGYGPGKANAIHVSGEVRRALYLLAYEQCGVDDDIEAAMAGIVGALVEGEVERRRVAVEPRVAEGTVPVAVAVVPDDGAWLVASPARCRITDLALTECACSGCSAARRRR